MASNNNNSAPTITTSTSSHPLKAFEAKASARYNANIVSAVDLAPAEGPILTGIGFLDHMLDQFNSHAQIGLSVVITDFGSDEDDDDDDDIHKNRNRHADHDQAKLLSLVGAKVGAEFHRLLAHRGHHVHQPGSIAASSSRFVCPLDESLVACKLTPVATGHGKLIAYTLPPYGKFPSTATATATGRTKLGHLETAHLELFWSSLAAHAHLELQFDKIDGDNGHHIVEASFKAMARGLRNLLDGTNTTFTGTENNLQQQQQAAALEALYGPSSENFQQGIALHRHASICRKTKETNIQVALNMNGGPNYSGGAAIQDEAGSVIQVDTGIAVLDQFLTDMFTATQYMSAQVICQDGDLHIDEHHTVEDVAITLGQVLHKTLGTKAGLNRMWCSSSACASSSSTTAQQGDDSNNVCKVEVVLDLSNRPMLCCHNLNLGQSEMVGDLPVELIPHFLESFIVQARLTCHIVCEIPNTTDSGGESSLSTRDLLYCIATALGTALRYCCMADSRRAGATASSKGTLST